VFLLGDDDRWVRYAAYQLVSKHRLGVEGGSERLAERARLLHDAALRSGRPDWELGAAAARGDDFLLDALRRLGLILRGTGFPGERQPDYAALFPHPDERVSRELALLFGSERPAGCVEPLLAALEAEEDREQQIHYAYCLTMKSGVAPPLEWTDGQARRLLRWFDQAETWSGGLSFGGYLAAMRARLAERFDGEARLRLALTAPKKERLGLRSVAQLASGLAEEQVDRLVPAIQYAWA
jgi:hypothetical protein